MTARAAPLCDVIGVGFGPSNLALAIALAETPAARGLRYPLPGAAAALPMARRHACCRAATCRSRSSRTSSRSATRTAR
uniref:SidA/IucD/PvdA family monooxygenase n=1 Tax=Methylobacterium sp. B34 TaxID=95563 RepID=UPI0027D7AE13|nr:SidA/IucD/PvdA family monooxygenase [Methylobacterium sp. B34]